MKDPLLRKAQKRVKKKKAFFTHAFVMASVSVFMIIIWVVNNDADYTGLYITLASLWLSVAIHYFSVFGMPGVRGDMEDWEATELEKEYFRLKRLEDTKKNLSDEEYLELKELEKRHRDEDFV